jgi:hypothetical protein
VHADSLAIRPFQIDAKHSIFALNKNDSVTHSVEITFPHNLVRGHNDSLHLPGAPFSFKAVKTFSGVKGRCLTLTQTSHLDRESLM